MESLREILDRHPEALLDKRKLKGIIADYYAADPLKKNVYRGLIEEEIIDALQTGKALNNIGLTRYVKKMATKRGTNKKVAENAILEWCDALGVAYNPDELEEAKENQKQQKELNKAQKAAEKKKKKDPKYKELDDIFNSMK